MSAESHAIQQAAAEFIRDRHLLGAFVTGLLREVHAAEDVLQEVWVLLSAELEKGTRIQNQMAWRIFFVKHHLELLVRICAWTRIYAHQN